METLHSDVNSFMYCSKILSFVITSDIIFFSKIRWSITIQVMVKIEDGIKL